MKKPFVVFGFLVTLFVSAIFGDYAIPRGDFAPRLSGSALESLQHSVTDFLAGASGGLVRTVPAAQESRSDVALVASNNARASQVAVSSNSAAAGSLSARALDTGHSRGTAEGTSGGHSAAFSPGGAGAAGGGGGGGSGGGSGGGGGAGEKSKKSGTKANSGDEESEDTDTVAGGLPTPRRRGGSDNSTERNDSTPDSNNSKQGNDRFSGAPGDVTNPAINLPGSDDLLGGGLGPIAQNPVTDYLGVTPGLTTPSLVTEQETGKAAAPVQAPAAVVVNVPDSANTIALLAIALVGLPLVRRFRR
jgi:hypothetical protein